MNPSMVYAYVKKAMNNEVPKSIVVGTTYDFHKKVVLDIAHGTEGIGGLSEHFTWQKMITESISNCLKYIHILANNVHFFR